MTIPRPRLGRASLAVATLLAISTLSTIPPVASSATAEPETITPGPAPTDVRTLGDPVAGPSDLDAAAPRPPASSARPVSALGAVTARWNSLGTPASLLPASGSLGTAPGTPVAAARAWLREHASVFGWSATDVDSLVLVNAQKLARSEARAVLSARTSAALRRHSAAR